MDYLPFADAHSEVKLVLAHLGNSGDMRPDEGGGASAACLLLVPITMHLPASRLVGLALLFLCLSSSCKTTMHRR